MVMKPKIQNSLCSPLSEQIQSSLQTQSYIKFQASPQLNLHIDILTWFMQYWC